MTITDEEAQARVALHCDTETTEEERVKLEASIRLGAALDEARGMAEELATLLSRLHHEYWQTSAEAMLLSLLIDARWLRDNLMGWDDDVL